MPKQAAARQGAASEVPGLKVAFEEVKKKRISDFSF